MVILNSGESFILKLFNKAFDNDSIEVNLNAHAKPLHDFFATVVENGKVSIIFSLSKIMTYLWYPSSFLLHLLDVGRTHSSNPHP